MSSTIRRVSYFHTTIRDQPGAAYRMLAQLADLGVNLLALTGIPFGSDRTQLTLFPELADRLHEAAEITGLKLDGPHPALLVQGDDELGALVGIHQQLFQAGVNVYASSGVTDGRGSYGYLLYVRPEQYEQAAEALGI